MNKKLLLSLLTIGTLFISCGKKDNLKEILVYSSFEDDYISDYIVAFNKEYPNIKVNLVRDSFGIISARFDSEKQNPQSDVVWGVAATNFIQNTDYLYPIEYNVKDIDNKFYDESSESPKWVGLSLAMTVFSVNTKEIPFSEKPNSYKDLIKKEYQGKVIMPNPSSSGTGYYTVSALIQLMGEKKAWRYMDELNNNIEMYVHSGSAPTKMTAQGESAIGIGMGYESLKEEKNGAPIVTVFPKEGSGWEMEIVGVTKKENIKPEAEIFAKWAVSENAMKMYAKNRGVVTDKRVKPLLEGYPKDISKQLIKNNLLWAAENRDRILKEWESRYGKKN